MYKKKSHLGISIQYDVLVERKEGTERHGYSESSASQNSHLQKKKKILKYCSKTSSIGTKLKAKMLSAVPHSEVITHSLFTRRPPSTAGTRLQPALAARYTLPHLSMGVLPPEVMLCSPLFSCYSIDAPSYTSAHSKPCYTLLLVIAVPERSIHNCLLWPPPCWKQFCSYSDFLFLMINDHYIIIIMISGFFFS